MSFDNLRDAVVIKRRDKTLVCEGYLDIVPCDKPPMEMQAAWSRFKVTILDKTNNNKNVVFANIPTRDAGYIKHRFGVVCTANEICVNAVSTANNASSNAVSSAFTSRFTMGKLKGKSPAQVILEGNVNEVKQQITFLAQNLQKFPKNQTLIDACNEALFYYEEGTLQARMEEFNQQGNANAFEGEKIIYSKEYKFLGNKRKQNGKCFVYSVKFSADFTNKYPFKAYIQNCYCNVMTTSNGGANVVGNSAEDILNAEFSMSEEEFFSLVDKMENLTHLYDIANTQMLFNHLNIKIEEQKQQNH